MIYGICFMNFTMLLWDVIKAARNWSMFSVADINIVMPLNALNSVFGVWITQTSSLHNPHKVREWHLKFTVMPVFNCSLAYHRLSENYSNGGPQLHNYSLVRCRVPPLTPPKTDLVPLMGYYFISETYKNYKLSRFQYLAVFNYYVLHKLQQFLVVCISGFLRKLNKI